MGSILHIKNLIEGVQPHQPAAYLTHKEPYFKVTIGNFYTKLQAKKVKNEIRKKYNSYIVPSKIVIYD